MDGKMDAAVDIPRKKGGKPAGGRGRESKRPSLESLAQLYACYTAPELAEMYGVSVNTVRSWIARARRQHAEYAALEAEWPQAARKGSV